jgi:hypothetical protein
MIVGRSSAGAMLWSRDGSETLLDPPTHFGAAGWASAVAVNNAGQIAGTTSIVEAPHSAAAWRLDPDGEVLTLSTTGLAEDINEAGAVAGAIISPEGWRAARWDPSGTLDFIGEPGTMATALNDHGAMVGVRLLDDPYNWGSQPAPVRWDPTGAVTDLPSLGSDGRAEDLANTGEVTGRVGSTAAHWDAAGALTLAPTPGWGLGINEAGLVVGLFDGAAGVWDPGGGAVLELPRNDADHATAYDVSEDGVVAGIVQISSVGSGETIAAIWFLDGLPAPPQQAGPSNTASTAAPTPTSAPPPPTTSAPPAVPVPAPPRYTG